MGLHPFLCVVSCIPPGQISQSRAPFTRRSSGSRVRRSLGILKADTHSKERRKSLFLASYNELNGFLCCREKHLGRRFMEAYLGMKWEDILAINQELRTEGKKEGLRFHTEEEEETKFKWDLQSPFISPQFADVEGFPPLFISAGAIEPFHRDIRLFCAKCIDSGVTIKLHEGANMDHAYPVLSGVKYMSHIEVDKCLVEMARWVDSFLPVNKSSLNSGDA